MDTPVLPQQDGLPVGFPLGAVKKYTFDFTAQSQTWTAPAQTKAAGGVDWTTGASLNGFTSVVMDSSGLRGVGPGTTVALWCELSEIHSDIDLREASPTSRIWGFLLEFSADGTNKNLLIGDAVIAGQAGHPTLAGVQRDPGGFQLKLFGGYGVFDADVFHGGITGSDVRAIGMVFTGGQMNAYFDNNGGAGPGQVPPTSLTRSRYFGGTGNVDFCEDNAGRLLVVTGGENLTRFTAWAMDPASGVEQ
jgi:hypothetical protein